MEVIFCQPACAERGIWVAGVVGVPGAVSIHSEINLLLRIPDGQHLLFQPAPRSIFFVPAFPRRRADALPFELNYQLVPLNRFGGKKPFSPQPGSDNNFLLVTEKWGVVELRRFWKRCKTSAVGIGDYSTNAILDTDGLFIMPPPFDAVVTGHKTKL